MNDTLRFIVVFLLLAAAALVINLHRDTEIPANKSFSEFPSQIGQWRMTQQTELSENVLSVLKARDYLFRRYTDTEGRPVGLYIGYHGGGKDSGVIHSPKHCLPGSGWYEVSTQRSVLETSRGPLNLVRSVYQKGEDKELFLYWFQVRDRSISDEFSLKLAEIINSAFYKRRDESFIRISVPVTTDVGTATKRAEAFIGEIIPLLREFLPQ